MGRATWLALAAATVALALIEVARSPLLAWRDPVYIAASFAGVAGMALLLAQPVLARGTAIPGLSVARCRRVHRWTGALLVGAVIVHVAALWLTSPPDVIDVLLVRSPTPFSIWGNLAMWAVFLSAGLALVRRRLGPRRWRRAHRALALVIVAGSVVHAMLIEGAMGNLSKALLCGFVLWATALLFLPGTGAGGRARGKAPRGRR